MAIGIEAPEDNASLTEFVLFHDRVYAYRSDRRARLRRQKVARSSRGVPYSGFIMPSQRARLSGDSLDVLIGPLTDPPKSRLDTFQESRSSSL
jgi:hypothetical protein